MVVPGLPHHITQRGNRRQQTFFQDEDYAAYVELMAEWCGQRGVEVWAYCLMPNHVHLIVVPRSQHGLRRAIGEAHRRYTRRINFREKWRGYLWQGRFASFVMDEPYLLAAARYVELNPVRAGLVADAAEWPFSSAKPHLSGRDDRLVKVGAMLAIVDDWCALLDSALEDDEQIVDKCDDHGLSACGGSFRLGNGDYTKSSSRAVSEIATTAGCFSFRSTEMA